MNNVLALHDGEQSLSFLQAFVNLRNVMSKVKLKRIDNSLPTLLLLLLLLLHIVIHLLLYAYYYACFIIITFLLYFILNIILLLNVLLLFIFKCLFLQALCI